MTRVTDNEVKAVIDTVRDTTPFIVTATLVVDEHLLTQSYSVGRLKQIELYLAAHYVAITEERGGLKFSKAGDASEAYEGSYTKGLDSTRYGQQAMTLDINGVLTDFAVPKPKAQFSIV